MTSTFENELPVESQQNTQRRFAPMRTTIQIKVSRGRWAMPLTVVCLLAVLSVASVEARGQQTGDASIDATAFAAATGDGERAAVPPAAVSATPLADEERARLLGRIHELEQRVAELEAQREVPGPAVAASAVAAGLVRPEIAEPRPGTAIVSPQAGPPAGAAVAQEPAGPGGNLAQQALDPTAPLLQHTMKTTFSPSHWGIDQEANVVTYQAVIPFKVWGHGNVLRANIPYTSNGPIRAGINDVTVFDLVIFKKPVGTFGIGPVVNFRRNNITGDDTVEAGPAFVYIGTKGKWQYGMLMQNFFSTSSAKASFQPILAYQLGQGWAVSLGDDQYVADWKHGDMLTAPVSVQFGKVTKIGSQPVRFFVNPQYNVNNTFGTAKWSVTFGFTILCPAGR